MRLFVCFDHETSELKAPFGHLLCCSFLPVEGTDLVTFRLDDRQYRGRAIYDDSRLVRAVKEYMEDCLIWVGWNSKQFDNAFFNARLALAGLPPLEKRMHIDLMYYSRPPFMKLYSSRLDAVAKTFGLAEQKTDLDPDLWIRAAALEKDAMNYVVDHNRQDVIVTKAVFKILAPHIKNIHC